MILRLTRGRNTVAVLAIFHNAGVIENSAGEFAGGMAYTAILIGNNMPGSLALGKHTVVTRLTVVNDPNVFKRRRQESGRYVALTAIRICRYVIARLANGNATVVA